MQGPQDLPEGWQYGGTTMTQHPDRGSIQVVRASKTFYHEDGGMTASVAMATSIESLVIRCFTIDALLGEEKKAGEQTMKIRRSELRRVLNENDHLSHQIGEMQQSCTLKEMQLRAHRRVKLPDDQAKALQDDLEATAREVAGWYTK